MSVNSRRRRKRREALWSESPYCFWCGKLTMLTEAMKRNTATLDHLYSRLHPDRKGDGLRDTVLACHACNIHRADCESKGAYFMPKLTKRIVIARETCATFAALRQSSSSESL